MWGSGIEVGSLSQVLFQDCLVCLLAFVMLMHSNCLVCWFCHARALKLSCFMHSANLLLGVGTLLDSSSAFLFCFGFKICSFNITCSSVYLYKSWLLVKNLSLWYHLAQCSGRVMEESWWERRMWNKFRFVCFCEIFSLKIFMILWQGWYKKGCGGRTGEIRAELQGFSMTLQLLCEAQSSYQLHWCHPGLWGSGLTKWSSQLVLHWGGVEENGGAGEKVRQKSIL